MCAAPTGLSRKAINFGKKLIGKAALNDTIWRMINSLVIPVVHHAETVRKNGADDDFIPRAINETFPDLVVRHGPFQGMKWMKIEYFYSPQFQKLLGSYETEIHPIIEKICQSGYSDVVDIGCAEGYYGIGFAIRLPTAQIYAFDTDRRATEYCQKLAELNHVEQRVQVASFCSSETLSQLPFHGRALIFCDVEGYEAELFTESVVVALKNHDLLIELHDFIDISISTNIRRKFENSHNCQCVESIDDIKKVLTYDYPELQQFNLKQRAQLIAERRPSIQQWFYLTSKNASRPTA